ALLEQLALNHAPQRARAGEAGTLASTDALALAGVDVLTPPRPPLPWSRILLWSVLVAAVLALAGMARRVYRQMNAPTDRQ
ncbi:MAG: DUF3999 family protein, partial [Pseudomonadota bacterium]